MSAVAERSIGRHFAVAEFVIARFGHIKNNRAKSRHHPLALSIAEGVKLRVAATAPVVALAASKENMSRENTSESGHRCRAVVTFFIRTRLG